MGTRILSRDGSTRRVAVLLAVLTVALIASDVPFIVWTAPDGFVVGPVGYASATYAIFAVVRDLACGGVVGWLVGRRGRAFVSGWLPVGVETLVLVLVVLFRGANAGTYNADSWEEPFFVLAAALMAGVAGVALGSLPALCSAALFSRTDSARRPPAG